MRYNFLQRPLLQDIARPCLSLLKTPLSVHLSPILTASCSRGMAEPPPLNKPLPPFDGAAALLALLGEEITGETGRYGAADTVPVRITFAVDDPSGLGVL